MNIEVRYSSSSLLPKFGFRIRSNRIQKNMKQENVTREVRAKQFSLSDSDSGIRNLWGRCGPGSNTAEGFSIPYGMETLGFSLEPDEACGSLLPWDYQRQLEIRSKQMDCENTPSSRSPPRLESVVCPNTVTNRPGWPQSLRLSRE